MKHSIIKPNVIEKGNIIMQESVGRGSIKVIKSSLPTTRSPALL